MAGQIVGAVQHAVGVGVFRRVEHTMVVQILPWIELAVAVDILS